MGLKAKIAYPLAKRIAAKIQKQALQAVNIQEAIRIELVKKAQHTAFGKAHQFDQIQTYADFKRRIPIRDYEGLKPYVERIKQGEENVLWHGKPVYFAKTSGTTSGVKYIPITKESIPNHFSTARNALFNYMAETNNSAFMDGNMIFLSGSPVLEEVNGILTGRLSGISNHLVPNWLKGNQLPTWQTNCIEDWEEKLEHIVTETLSADMRLISGIPPWVQMYYERLLERTGKSKIKDIFPNYTVFVYGGVNFEPYRAVLEGLVGEKINSVETYPASEGFIAFQDSQTVPGLLLNVASGIFFEFIPLEQIHSSNPTRFSLAEVQLGVNYVIIINSNAGLWGYNIGDTVEFVSLAPFRIIVTGRVKHFISAFGEHVIGKEVEEALRLTCQQQSAKIVEFTVAPNVTPLEGGLPYHEWLIEFEQLPQDLSAFTRTLDQEMTKQNVYYFDLIDGNILQPLKITTLPKDTFRQYMKTEGKLGGQNKVPRLSNDRKIAEPLIRLVKNLSNPS
jgi:hypothetical protein